MGVVGCARCPAHGLDAGRHRSAHQLLEQRLLVAEIGSSVPLATPARAATSSSRAALKPRSANTASAASRIACRRVSGSTLRARGGLRAARVAVRGRATWQG